MGFFSWLADRFQLSFTNRSVEHEALQNLRPGIRSPYNACIDYQRFVSALAYNSTSPPTTRVTDDGMFITFGSNTLSIAKWRAGLQRLCSELTQELDRICDGQEFGLTIPEQSRDDWGNDVRGYGWTTTADFLQDKRSLLKHMLNDPSQHLAYIDPKGKLQISRPEAWGFLHKCDVIVEKLALFAFLTAGQPPRVTEFIDDKYTNSTRPRNMFHDHDAIWLVTRRVKTENITQQETFIPIKCHPQLTKLFERYLLIVRPVEAELVHIIKGEAAYHTYKEFLWTKSGDRMTSTDMYRSIKDFMSDYCDVDIGAHDYRQIVVEIGRVFLGSEDEVNRETVDVLAGQSGHTALMAQRKYALEVGHIPAMSSDLLLRYGHISESWWKVIGFMPGTPPMLPLRARSRMQLPSAPQVGVSGSGNPTTGSTIDIQMLFQQQAALIQQQTALMHAQMTNINTTIRAEVRSAVAEALATLETQYHNQGPSIVSRSPSHPSLLPVPVVQPEIPSHNDPQPMDVSWPDDDCEDMYVSDHEPASREIPPPPSPLPLPPPPPPISSPLPETPEVIQRRPVLPRRHQQTNPLYDPSPQESDYLHQLLADHFPNRHPPPTFTSPQQMQAISMAIEGKDNFVLVLPTGGGKSLVFTLPAMHEQDRQTFVVVPNKALLTDQKQGARKLGLKVDHWNAKKRQIDPDAQLVMLAMESAGSEYFRRSVICPLS